MSAATRTAISQWFDEGLAKGASHMAVFSDRFNHEDYPVYVMPGENSVKTVIEHQKGKNKTMVSLMEVYDLKLDKEAQLNEGRAFHY